MKSESEKQYRRQESVRNSIARALTRTIDTEMLEQAILARKTLDEAKDTYQREVMEIVHRLRR